MPGAIRVTSLARQHPLLHRIAGSSDADNGAQVMGPGYDAFYGLVGPTLHVGVTGSARAAEVDFLAGLFGVAEMRVGGFPASRLVAQPVAARALGARAGAGIAR